jgi:hypothetical protein
MNYSVTSKNILHKKCLDKCVARVRFLKWFCVAVCSDEIDPLLSCFRDQAWLRLKRNLNIQNKNYWSEHKSRILFEIQLYGIKCEACYTASEIRISKVTFFSGTINSEKYRPHIVQAFSEILSEGKWEYGCFQDDCETVRTSSNSMTVLSNIFGGWIICRPQWPAPSSVLTPLHYHSSPGMKYNIYRNNTHTQESTFEAIDTCAVSAT